jgi:hypothetical protein
VGWAFHQAAWGSTTLYFAFVYMVVPEADFGRGTALVQGAHHLGNVLGSGLGQLLVSYGHVSLHTLFYLSLGFTCAAIAVFLTAFPVARVGPPPSLVGQFWRSGLKPTWVELSTM